MKKILLLLTLTACNLSEEQFDQLFSLGDQVSNKIAAETFEPEIELYVRKGERFYNRARDYCEEAKKYEGERRYERIMLCARYFTMAAEQWCGAAELTRRWGRQTNNQSLIDAAELHESVCETTQRIAEQTALRTR